ncbi:hypothetical protein ACH4GZ_39055 [Streptomyces hygroscopicus]|uniref:hypothetical protein n=1 Tax=Streptomyces hygroscopicus TaxID=1912 RepID=UPI0037B4A6BB
MAKLVKAVFVRDPDKHQTVILRPGEEPEPRLAALVTAPEAWEDGELPAAALAEAPQADGKKEEPRDSGDTKPAAKKAAARPARGRKSADEGGS